MGNLKLPLISYEILITLVWLKEACDSKFESRRISSDASSLLSESLYRSFRYISLTSSASYPFLVKRNLDGLTPFRLTLKFFGHCPLLIWHQHYFTEKGDDCHCYRAIPSTIIDLHSVLPQQFCERHVGIRMVYHDICSVSYVDHEHSCLILDFEHPMTRLSDFFFFLDNGFLNPNLDRPTSVCFKWASWAS